MKHWVTYPLIQHPASPELLTGEALIRFARTAEAAGFAGIGFTDHPAPTHRWLAAGGHDALDPFAALAFVAGATERVRLIPNVCVLPYRNPFIVAKAVATIASLSGGRFVLAAGTGYLRGEYRALGVDPDERNELFDEAIAVMRAVWERDDVAFEGRHFSARGQTANPKPKERVPIWIGGNSGRARQRVADFGDGWNPFRAPAEVTKTSRTAALESVDDLADALGDLRRRLEAAGRDLRELDVAFSCTAGGSVGSDRFDADAHRAELARMAEIGVTWNGVTVPGDSLAHALEALERYGREVIACDGTG